jgi:tetratricopeptide (TPR) repeat protein
VAAEPPPDSAIAQARVHFEQGRDAYRKGQLKQALEHLRSALALAPSPELEFDLGRVYDRMGEAERAIAHYSRYLDTAELAPAERARIAARIGELHALVARQRTQAKAPPPSSEALTAEARAFFVRGLKLFARKKYEAAIAAFEAARSFAPLPELTYNLALASERLGRTADAVDHYRAYLREVRDADDAERVRERIKELMQAGK